MNLLDSSLAQISQEVPGATAIFNHYNLSFCCGGKKILKEAIADKKIEQNEILSALLKLSDQDDVPVNWDDASDEELMIFLSARSNDIYRTQLPELFRLADRVETVHGDKAECPRGLASQINATATLVGVHLKLETTELFPKLKNTESTNLESSLEAARNSLDKLVTAILKIDELTNDVTTPAGVCNTWNALYLGLRAFKADLKQHIHLENDILISRHSSAVNLVDPKEQVHGEDFCCGSCGGS